mgnify:FL=1
MLDNNINYIKLGRLTIKLPISGFLKSRFISIVLFITNIFPLYSLLKREKPDYLIIHLLTFIPLTLLIFFNFNTKFILRISGLPRLNFFRKLLWKLINKKITLVTCPSKATFEFIKKSRIFDEDKIVMLHDPIINVSKISNKKNVQNIDLKNLNKNYFLSIGRLTRQKNHKLLIELFSYLKKNDNNFSLNILGEGEEKYFLNKMIVKLDLQDRVFLLGFKKMFTLIFFLLEQ